MTYHNKYPLPVASVSRSGYLVDTPGCSMPELDFFAPEVKKLFKKRVGFFPCPGQKSFIRVAANATLKINAKILYKNHQLRRPDANCSFIPILRNDKNDRFKMGRQMTLRFNTPLKYDAVRVICYKNMAMYHEEYLPLVPIKEEVETRCKVKMNGSATGESSLNVIILGMDSISKLNLRRHLPKTLSFLKEMRAVELKGYNKVGDNTFPNLLALLTGTRLTPQFKKLYKNKSFDDLALIWKEFSERLGYRTLMAEDNPKLAMFNYYWNGFLPPPADYYFRPFALSVEMIPTRITAPLNCLGPKQETAVVFDYVLDFVKTMGNDRPYFAFAFLSRLTHSALNFAGYADAPVLKMLKTLVKLGVANNSLIVFLSDHGMRYGKIRKTFVGRFEEHWPVMFLSFPNWFYQKHPYFYSNLIINQNRLTTPFDVHATLKHLLNLRDIQAPQVRSLNQRAISLFEEIPGERTCNDAGISEHFCTCSQLTPVDSNLSEVRSAALRLVDTVNLWLESQQTECVFLRLDRVIQSHVSQSSRAATDVLGKVGHLDYLVAVVVSPSGAEFEATLRWTRRNSSFSVLGDISRINAYNQQSDCIDDPWLKKFCFCKTLLKENG